MWFINPTTEYLSGGPTRIDLDAHLGDNGDPDNFLASLLGCSAIGSSNASQWCNAEFENTISLARQTSNIAQRTRYYETAQRIFKEEAPWVPLAHSVVVLPMRRNVEGFVMSPLGTVKFFAVDLK